ncbi:hypothetical protein [Micromonospora matsumotoense]|uniref:hypothetical protein n=1 Tax=Micromonospora matsumotoense TaxID=121616 RepID=UPI0033DF9931
MSDPDLREQISRSITGMTDAIAAEAAAKVAREAAIGQVLENVAALRAEAENRFDPSYLAVVRHLYWHHKVIPVAELVEASGFGYVAELLSAIGPVKSGVVCETCGADIMRTSRSWQPPRRYWNNPVECETCQKASRDVDYRQRQLQALREQYAQQARYRRQRWTGRSRSSWCSPTRRSACRSQVMMTTST